MDLNIPIQHLYPDALPERDYVLRDDGNGPYIEAWYRTDPQPTQAELDQAYADSILEYTKRLKKKEVNSERDKHKNKGVTWNTYVFDSDPESRENISGVVNNINAGHSLPTGFTFRDANNNDIPMTDADMKSLGNTLMTFVNQVYQASWDHKTNIDALTTKADVEAYDITTGWPT